MKKHIATTLTAFMILGNLSLPVQADDLKFIASEKAHAASRLDGSQTWIHAKMRALFGCDRDCQIDQKIKEIRNEPIGSLGIRG